MREEEEEIALFCALPSLPSSWRRRHRQSPPPPPRPPLIPLLTLCESRKELSEETKRREAFAQIQKSLILQQPFAAFFFEAFYAPGFFFAARLSAHIKRAARELRGRNSPKKRGGSYWKQSNWRIIRPYPGIFLLIADALFGVSAYYVLPNIPRRGAQERARKKGGGGSNPSPFPPSGRNFVATRAKALPSLPPFLSLHLIPRFSDRGGGGGGRPGKWLLSLVFSAPNSAAREKERGEGTRGPIRQRKRRRTPPPPQPPSSFTQKIKEGIVEGGKPQNIAAAVGTTNLHPPPPPPSPLSFSFPCFSCKNLLFLLTPLSLLSLVPPFYARPSVRPRERRRRRGKPRASGKGAFFWSPPPLFPVWGYGLCGGGGVSLLWTLRESAPHCLGVFHQIS